MNSRKFYGIYNPKARGGRTKKYSEKIAEVFSEQGFDFSIDSSESINDARGKVKHAIKEGYDTLIAIGGDGTVHHIANAVLDADLTFAVVPAGSGNDFAGAIGMSNDIEHSIATLLNGRTERLSTVRSTSSEGEFWTVNIADVGLGAKVSYAAERKLKWMAGQIKYDLISMWEIVRAKKYNCRVTLDGQEEEIQLFMLIAGMGQTAGSGMNFLPDVRFNQNELQGGMILTNCNKFQLLTALQKVRKAQHKGLSYIRMFRAKRVTIESLGEEIMIESEGELRGTTKVTMEVIPNKFKVIVPETFDFNQESLLTHSSRKRK